MKKWEMPEVMELGISNTECHSSRPGRFDHGWGCPDVKPECKPDFES